MGVKIGEAAIGPANDTDAVPQPCGAQQLVHHVAAAAQLVPCVLVQVGCLSYVVHLHMPPQTATNFTASAETFPVVCNICMALDALHVTAFSIGLDMGSLDVGCVGEHLRGNCERLVDGRQAAGPVRAGGGLCRKR